MKHSDELSHKHLDAKIDERNRIIFLNRVERILVITIKLGLCIGVLITLRLVTL